MYIIAIIFVINVFAYCLDVFDNYMQQDAHEFFNYLLNTIGDLLQGTECAVYMLCPTTRIRYFCENLLIDYFTFSSQEYFQKFGVYL